jgi:hypothetical protein
MTLPLPKKYNCNIHAVTIFAADPTLYDLIVACCFRLLHVSIARPTLAIDDIRAEEPPLPIPRH